MALSRELTRLVDCGYAYGHTGCGQKILYQLGMTGIPIINVSNACASGSAAIALARQAVEAGIVECSLAVGFEVMKPGPSGYLCALPSQV
jgi:sterol carrier protein 2